MWADDMFVSVWLTSDAYNHACNQSRMISSPPWLLNVAIAIAAPHYCMAVRRKRRVRGYGKSKGETVWAPWRSWGGKGSLAYIFIYRQDLPASVVGRRRWRQAVGRG